jgi:CheY-like chemotaxis protein
MSILIVEDNPVNARLLALMLQAQGYQTVVARNGKEGLTTVSETPDIQLIITDYMMPEMDGLEFIVKVRALPAFNQIFAKRPVSSRMRLMLSATEMDFMIVSP